MQFSNQIETYSSNIPTNVGIFGLIELQLIMWKLDRMCNQVPLDNPMNCPKAIAWDSYTLAGWIQQNIWQQRVKILIELIVRSAIGCEANEISFLFFLWYIRQNGGLEPFVTI